MIARTVAVPIAGRPALVLLLASVAGVMAFAWPLLVSGPPPADRAMSPLVFVAVLPVLVLVALVEVSAGRLDARALAMLGVLSALGAAIRPLGAGAAGIETVFVLLVVGGRIFGPGFGFLLGSTTLFASALLTGGVGPWLPFQMLAASWMGLGAGLLPPARGRAELALLAAYSLGAALIYGLGMNLWFWPFATGVDSEVAYVAGAPLVENLRHFLAFSLVTSLGWDIGRAITTTLLLVGIGAAAMAALRRAARRAAFVEA
jgi:energy-coupling factor transport system substrate-specific component